MLTTYQQAVIYLEKFIKPTVFRRVEVEEAGKKDPLDRMRKLLELLGNPQDKFKSIQVSGTSGKGSTAYFISHFLATAGYKTGFTFSPHLQEVTERIVISDKQISKKKFVGLVKEVQSVIEQMEDEPSYFEILMAMAFLFFAQEKVDIAVVEVGIEGKYDASNTLNPLVAVLTNIDLDHTEFLGNTVEEIAGEAVSVIRNYESGIRNHGRKQIVISGAKQDSVVKIIEQKCRETGAELFRLGKEFHVEMKEETINGSAFDFIFQGSTLLQGGTLTSLKNLFLSMIGEYQIENAGIAIETVLQLQRFGFKITEEHIKQALSTAFFPGRFEVFTHTPYAIRHTLILDGAHNPAKMKAFLSSLKKIFPVQKRIFIVAFKEDKDVNAMLEQVLELADVLIITQFKTSIGYKGAGAGKVLSIKYLVLSINKKRKIPIYYEEDSRRTLEKAKGLVQSPKDIIIVTGSLYLVGEIRRYLKKHFRS